MSQMKSEIRELNGYRLLFIPDHPKAMKSDNWVGYVYEHIVVVEKDLGRELTNEEIVHHLDGNRSNNRIENLLVLSRGQHGRLHVWLKSGAVWLGDHTGNGLNSGNAKLREPTYCKSCRITLQRDQENYCSVECAIIGTRKVKRPSKSQLEKEIVAMSFLALGRKYGVTDNAVRKWAKQYGILSKPILSQSSGIPEAGAETTGEVQSS